MIPAEIAKATLLCEQLISGELPAEQVAAVLLALQEKGESASEIAGFAQAIIGRATAIPFAGETVDLCGTGGSQLERFNVSTTVAFIVSCCGLTVAKHGNKGTKKPNGSFDLLEGLGIPIELEGDQLAHSLERQNLAFIFARKAHPAMRNVAAARKITSGRTIFNLAGPLSNPTRVGSQVIGTADPLMMERLLDAARLLGRKNTIVVYGEPGIDELSLSGHSHLSMLSQDAVRHFSWHPSELDLGCVDYSRLPVGTVDNNLRVFESLLDNEKLAGINDMVCLNAGLSLWSGGAAGSLLEGYQIAKKVVSSGELKRKFKDYRQFAQGLDQKRN